MTYIEGANPVTNTEDVIDSRDVIARIGYLERTGGAGGDEQGEYEDLLALTEEAGGASDWRYGEVLIRDDYFEDYARQLADDVGAIDGNAGWPLMHIDWEAAAQSLQSDYTSVQFGGITYWLRW